MPTYTFRVPMIATAFASVEAKTEKAAKAKLLKDDSTIDIFDQQDEEYLWLDAVLDGRGASGGGNDEQA